MEIVTNRDSRLKQEVYQFFTKESVLFFNRWLLEKLEPLRFNYNKSVLSYNG